ncbi:MAG TPA: type II toxin-antitoxin system Phd/YefM family antitoxin [Opitutales bacterium]|jgi:prevent-host-death family protein|nr:type II toxin-antitoxin system Phd/YefM family antitoxin [Opitutales bacterium]
MKTALVTSLKRRATAIISGLQADRDPILITHRGRPAAYLLDVETYEALHQRLSVLEGLALGERAIREGRVLSHRAAKKRLARWLS